MKLFAKNKVAGIFRGFSEGGLEFHADIILPYNNEFQNAPMHGQFLVVQLETEEEGVLGRITSIASEGRLASTAGEDYAIRAVGDERPIGENLREQYLRYRVNIRVLGVLRVVDGKVEFAASHRRLPHVGSRVAFLNDDLLREIAGHNDAGADIGFLAMGEFIYGANDRRLRREPWMQVTPPGVIPKFPASSLVSRRSFVFARAGFGKSNLVKLLFSNLYRQTPTVQKRGNRQVPVGTLIFDPDGEYFWPDDKGRPGLCDVAELRDKLVVFTPKEGPSDFYASFVAGNIKLDIRRLRPTDVISIALAPEKQDQQNVRKLKQLSDTAWRQLVDEIYRNRHMADETLLKDLLGLKDNQEAELLAARGNMTSIVAQLHDPGSQLVDKLLMALSEGKICIIDISQMRGSSGLILSGIILQKIFDHNQAEFTKPKPQTIPTIAVLEEAQSVLGHGSSGGEGPYVSWVKEGRKYDLGAVLITQQPGSIANEILSQGDNWFIFHLLSAGDLLAVKKANAHFSDDILSSLLNEPIPGHGVFWSSVAGRSYPVPMRVLSFESQHKTADPEYQQGRVDTYAAGLRERFDREVKELLAKTPNEPGVSTTEPPHPPAVDEPETVDVLSLQIENAIECFIQRKTGLIDQIRNRGVTWKGIAVAIEEFLPESMVDRSDHAHSAVRPALDRAFGRDAWKTERRPKKNDASATTTWVVLKRNPTGTREELGSF
jgi:hypothetical protein